MIWLRIFALDMWSDRRACRELLVRRVRQDPLDRLALPGNRDPRGRRVLPGSRDPQDRRANREFREQRANRDHKENRDRRAFKVLPDRRAFREKVHMKRRRILDM